LVKIPLPFLKKLRIISYSKNQVLMAEYSMIACCDTVVPLLFYVVNQPAAGRHVSFALKYPAHQSVLIISKNDVLVLTSLLTYAMDVESEALVL
jgi:hypothetical protein